jgi:RND family efflux transporter MFP subunit
MTNPEIEDPPLTPATTPAAADRPKWRGRLIAFLLVVATAAGLGVIIHSGITSRAAAESRLVSATDEAAIPAVNVVHPVAGAPIQEIVLPGNTQAFTDTPIYARTSGYLKKWYFDIGARVKQGDLLAEIETPEVDRQVQQARAELETAQANYHLAETTAARWEFLLKTNSVSKQETDQAISNLGATKATVDSNVANVHRLEELQSFEKVYAPFDGTVTARNTDIGALIGAGNNTPAQELFRLAAVHTLRVFVAVPEVYSRAAIPGATAMLALDEYPGKLFRGTLVRNSNAIDVASRTLLVEVDVDNAGGQLLPGAYVSVHLKLPEQARAVTIPSNTLLFRAEGLRAGVVQNGHAVLVPIKIGRDYGSTVEVVSGLRLSDAVILDPSDSLTTGTPVRVNNPQGGGAPK